MKRVIIIICVLLSVIINAQEKPDPSSFFPSAVRNVWEYSTDHGFVRQMIYSDSLGNDGSKFLFTDYQTNPLFKIDTVSIVYYLPFALNWKLYKLESDSGATWRVRTDPPGTFARVDKIYSANIFGKERYVTQIGFYRPPYPFTDTTITEETVYECYVLLVSGIGEYYEFDYESGPVRILQGCIIDGVTYGTVDVEEEIQTLPTEFVLYQNYPNPFNPATNIEYNLPNSANVTLKIYNSLGEEVRRLVEEYQQGGKHEVTFDARGLPNGVYFYSLCASAFSQTKKLLLMK
ncbi:MAG: T9SS type A sorting domain-containing protein [Ignavibacteriales bacterium]|nr:T9SS type A sorting domain-containing protein [Ignavibacteriales bacterium]